MKIRIGLIGAGLMGAAHSLMLRQIATFEGIDLQLTIVADPAADRVGGFASMFGYRERSTNPGDVIRHPEVNVVYITTPTRYHRELAEAAASAGKHIFCEKPLAFNEKDAKAMLDAAEKAGVRHQVGLVLRYSPTFNAVRRLLSQDLGFPMATIFRDDQVFPIKGIHASPWRANLEEAGAGTILEHSIHDVDILTWLFGPVRSLEATVDYLAGKKGIEDRAMVRFEFESGMIATLISLWHDVMRRPSNRLLEVFYEKGYVATDEDFLGPVKYQFGDCNLITISREEVLKKYLGEAEIDEKKSTALAWSAYGFEDLAFVNALIKGRRPEPGLDVAVAAHRIVDAIYESAKKHVSLKMSTLPDR